MRARIARDERGAEIVEFALVFPVIAFLIFGLIYGLFAVAAHVSLAHATSRGVRYASIPIDPVTGIYPSTDQVEEFVLDHTPFFSAASCTTTVAGDGRENVPVTLDVDCGFPNPAGAALNALRDVFIGSDGPETYDGSLQISAHAQARRE
jgi:Flp pilus assembly protein TadG